MKAKTFLHRLCAWAVGLIALSSVAYAQMGGALPRDPAVKVGQLDNGLTYFIRQNKLPEGRANFYIAQRVGSMQEEENQRGLAHFLEHIAFNGSKHFPGKAMINWLETIGVSFGGNLNAYTSFDETVYTIMDAPVQRKTVVDSCILILKDWSNGISLEDKEIDNERGVIQEEWRSRNNGNLRVISEVLRKSFPDNRYGERMPIGLMSVVKNFKYQELRDYYKKWYRPDLQALIIVGDINPDEVEATIKKLFADVPKPVNPAKRIYVEVPDHKGIIPAIATDPESGATRITVSFTRKALDREAKETTQALVLDYLSERIVSMANERLQEIMKKPGAPFLAASASSGSFLVAQTKDALDFHAIANEGQYKPALDALTAEIERIRQHGFTEGEYKRSVADFLVALKKSYNERDKRKNEDYADSYTAYFTKGGALIDAETSYQIHEMFAKQIPVAMVNQMAQQLLGMDNIVLQLTGPRKEGLVYPTEKVLVEEFQLARQKPVEAYKDTVSDEKLLEALPKAGKIVKEQKDGKYGTTVWTLSNGIQVIYKVTDFKQDEIRFSAQRAGGFFLYDHKPSDLQVARSLDQVINIGGLGKFDDTALSKVLSGRLASASPSISGSNISISGSTTTADLETLMQLIYLNFTQKRSDDVIFSVIQDQLRATLKIKEKNPMGSVSDSISSLLYGKDYLYGLSLTEKEIDNIDYARSMAIYRELFGNAYGFQFYFVGNIDPAKLRPLVETYLASLPAKKQSFNKHEEKVPHILKGKQTLHYSKTMSTPMALVLDVWSGTLKPTQENRLAFDILGSVLEQVYTETIREEEGGTYGVGVSASIGFVPRGAAGLQVFFRTDPEKVEKLNSRIKLELEHIAKEGIPQDKFDKVIANLEKNYNENLKENGYWMGHIANFYYEGRDSQTDYLKTLKGIKPQLVQTLLKELLAQGNYHELVLRPEADKK